MSIIKQLATYDGSAWTKDDIGANAGNVSFVTSAGASTTIAGSNNVQGALSNLCGASKLAGSSAIVTNSSGVLTASSVTSTELGYLSGVTSNLQGQIDTLNNNFGEHFNIGNSDSAGTTNNQIVIDSPIANLSQTNNGVSNYDYNSFIIHDKEKRIMGAYEVLVTPEGYVQNKIYVRNYDTNGNKLSKVPQLGIQVNKNNQTLFNILGCDRIRFNNDPIIKVVTFGWTASPTFAAKTKLITASLTNINEGTVPNGYTFAGWLMFATVGWVGSIYPVSPGSSTTDIWTVTEKNATTGTSIRGTALFIKTECI